MTWLKLSDDFSDDCARAELSDAAYRTHVEALNWTMRRETGGLIDAMSIRRFAETADPNAAIRELIEAGFWEPVGTTRLRVVHHMEHQPEPDLLAKRREVTAERVRRHRRKVAGMDDGERSNAVTERVTRVGSGRVGKTHHQEKVQGD